MDIEIEPPPWETDLESPPQSCLDKIVGNFAWAWMSGDKRPGVAAKPRRAEVQIVSQTHLRAPSSAPFPACHPG